MAKDLKKQMRKLLAISFAIVFLIPILSSVPVALAEEKKPIQFTPQVSMPGFSDRDKAMDVSSVGDGGFIKSDLLARYIEAIYDYGMKIGGILAAIMLMAGGVIWLTSGGDAGQVGKAKNIITGSITGLVLLFSSYFILNTINPNLVKMQGLSMIVPEKASQKIPTVCEEAMDSSACYRLGTCYWQEEKCIKKSDAGVILCSVNKADIQEKYPICCCKQGGPNYTYYDCKWSVGGGTKYCAASCGDSYTKVMDGYCSN